MKILEEETITYQQYFMRNYPERANAFITYKNFNITN